MTEHTNEQNEKSGILAFTSSLPLKETITISFNGNRFYAFCLSSGKMSFDLECWKKPGPEDYKIQMTNFYNTLIDVQNYTGSDPIVLIAQHNLKKYLFEDLGDGSMRISSRVPEITDIKLKVESLMDLGMITAEGVTLENDFRNPYSSYSMPVPYSKDAGLLKTSHSGGVKEFYTYFVENGGCDEGDEDKGTFTSNNEGDGPITYCLHVNTLPPAEVDSL